MASISVWKILVALCLLAIASTSFSSLDGFSEDGDSGMGPMDPYAAFDPYDNPHGAPDAAELVSLQDIDLFVKESDAEPAVVGFFDADAKAEELEHFKDIAKSESAYYRFAFTTSRDVLEEKKYSGCVVLVFPPSKYVNSKLGERSRHRFPGQTLLGPGFMEFIKLKSLPVVGQMTEQNMRRYESTGRTMLTVFAAVDLAKNPQTFHYIATRLHKLAKQKIAKDLLFNVADINEFEYAMQMDYGFAKINPKHIYVGLKYNNYHFAMEGEFSVDAVTRFIEGFHAGTIKGKLKTMGDAEDGDDADSAVVTLTSQNFDEVVNNPQKDVLVEFYAPWCGHCQSLKPEYRQLAEFFKNDEGVTIAAMDATANDVPKGFNVEGFPTLVFVSAKEKTKHVAYDGPRDAKAMTKFIQAHRTTQLEKTEL